MFGIRSDPFCIQYKQWEHNDRYKHDEDRKIFNLIKNNLKVLSEIPAGQNINQLDFKEDGRIVKLGEDIKISQASAKVQDLKKFTQFVQRYFQNKPLAEKEAREIREALTAAEKGIHHLSGPSISLLQYEHVLSLASELVVLNEKMETTGAKTLGEDLVVNKFKELQKEAIKIKKTLTITNTILKISLAATLGGFIGAIVTGTIPLLLPLFVPALLIGLIGFMTLYITRRWEQNSRHDYDTIIKELKRVDDFKNHYSEPEFKEFQKFLNQFPEDKKSLIADPNTFERVHRLYEIEKKYDDTVLKMEGERFLKKKLELEGKAVNLKKSMVDLREQLQLPFKEFLLRSRGG